MKYAIKRGPSARHKEPLYWNGEGILPWHRHLVLARKFDTRRAAERAIRKHRLFFESASVIRVRSAEEGRRKFAAAVLRKLAADVSDWDRAVLIVEADELWPARKR
jgi:hypothetical protein